MKIKNLFWFALLSLCCWCFAALGYYFINGFQTDFIGIVFTVFAIPGHLALFAAGLFFLSALFRLIGPKSALAAAFAFGLFFNLFFMTDLLIYMQYRFHISLAMLQLFFGPAGREIFVFPVSMYFLIALAVLLIAAFTTGLIWLARKITWGKKPVIIALLCVFTAMIGYNGLHAWGKFVMMPSILTQVGNLPWANPLSMNRRLIKMGYTPKAEPYKIPKTGHLNYPIHPLQCAAEDRPNILIILIDSWRFDVFSKEITPNLYQFFKNDPNGFYFKNHLAGGNATEAGVFSLFYSIPYSYWEAMTNSHTAPVLMDELNKLNYDWAVYASSRLDSPEFHQNVFSDVPNLRIQSNGVHKYERDLDAQKEFLNFLNRRDDKKPFFGFLFYDSLHGVDHPADYKGPFSPAVNAINYLRLSKNTDPAPYFNRYKNSAHFVDSLIGNVLKTLKAKGLDKNTIIIVTGDHGQEINDTRNNFWGHNSNFAKYQTWVPLLVHWPGKSGAEIDYRTSHYDLVPTLLQDALSCANNARDYSSGYNLFDPGPRPYTLILSYTKKAVRTGDDLSVLDNYGGVESHDADYQKTPQRVSPKVLTESLKEFSRFYK